MLPGLSQLKNTPEILETLLDDLSEDEAVWKPARDRWSIAEVMEHLSHVEGHGFRSRIDAMIGGTRPILPTYDQEALSAAGQYSGRDMEESFEHWRDQRETNVEFLLTLKDDDGKREGVHEKFGTITVGDLLNEWAFHDLGHVRQIVELLRSRRYFPNMGPFQSIYTIRP